MNRRQSIELKSVSNGREEPPIPPPSNISLREWFAGLALGNPELMKDVLTRNVSLKRFDSLTKWYARSNSERRPWSRWQLRLMKKWRVGTRRLLQKNAKDLKRCLFLSQVPSDTLR